jgi:anti-repressor protein
MVCRSLRDSWCPRSIRVFDIDGYRLAVGADICKVLDIKHSRDALANVDDGDKLLLRRSDTGGSTPGNWEQIDPRVQSVILVTENGATDLILQTRKPEARAFRRYLTHVVWPAIRDTGTYTVAPELEGEELLAAAMIEAGEDHRGPQRPYRRAGPQGTGRHQSLLSVAASG